MAEDENERVQVNVRLTPELAEQIDKRRIELKKELGRIPSRSEVVRIAVEEYLGGKRKQS